MCFRWFAGVLFAACSLAFATTASAAVILITQQKAVAGGVTPGDAAGFPVTLTQPGSYRLDGNLTVPAGKYSIDIRSHYVSIDMAGFMLSGFDKSGAKAAAYGIYGRTFGVVSVRNGIITGFKNSGIAIFNNQWVVEDMTITANGDPASMPPTARMPAFSTTRSSSTARTAYSAIGIATSRATTSPAILAATGSISAAAPFWATRSLRITALEYTPFSAVAAWGLATIRSAETIQAGRLRCMAP